MTRIGDSFYLFDRQESILCIAMDLTVTARAGKPHAASLKRLLKKAIPLVPCAPDEISVVLVGDKLMSELHLRDLNIAGPTDVLTYEIDHDPATKRCVAGEVIVCVPEAARQAKRRNSTIANELLLYSLHGVLHLAGFDDRTERAFRKMHTMEDDILTQIGVGPVFSPTSERRQSRKSETVSRKSTSTSRPTATARRNRANVRIGAI